MMLQVHGARSSMTLAWTRMITLVPMVSVNTRSIICPAARPPSLDTARLERDRAPCGRRTAAAAPPHPAQEPFDALQPHSHACPACLPNPNPNPSPNPSPNPTCVPRYASVKDQMTRHKLSLLWKPDEQPDALAATPAPAPASARAARRRGQASAQDRPPHGGGLSLSARAPFTVKPTAASSVRALQAHAAEGSPYP